MPQFEATRDEDGDIRISYGGERKYLYRGRFWYLPGEDRRDRHNVNRVERQGKRLISKYERQQRRQQRNQAGPSLATVVQRVNNREWEQDSGPSRWQRLVAWFNE